MEEQTLYLYQILDHGHVIHTSQCFPSLRRQWNVSMSMINHGTLLQVGHSKEVLACPPL